MGGPPDQGGKSGKGAMNMPPMPPMPSKGGYGPAGKGFDKGLDGKGKGFKGEGFEGKSFDKGLPLPSRPGPYEPPPGLGPPAEVNEMGLPMRPGREQCLVYLNTGICQNGLACIFDHPKGVKPPMLGKLPSGLPPPGLLPQPASPGLTGSSLSGLPPPLPGLVLPTGLRELPLPLLPGSLPEGLPMPPLAPLRRSTDDDDKDGDDKQSEVVKFIKPMTDDSKKSEPLQYNDEGLPMRPGTQKCGFYIRSGHCNYGPGCRFDHPPGLGGIMAIGQGMGNFPLMVGGPTTTEGGMARRPGKEQCPFLARTGACPFGPQCRFDHFAGGATSDDCVRKPPAAAAKTPVKDKGLGGVRGRRPASSFTGFRRP